MNDTLNARYGTSGAILRWSAPSLVLILVSTSAVFLVGPASLDRFVIMHSLAMFGFFVCQTGAMWRNGVHALPLAITAGFSFLILFSLAQNL
jgi:hypothetical protein